MSARSPSLPEILTLPAVELARRIRARELSSTEVVDAHLGRMAQVNPALNAVVVPRVALARREARRADADLARRSVRGDDLPPFFGVPFTVKELISVAGMPWTAGVVARRQVRGRVDAPQVARLRAAGGIVLGLTNVSEAGLWLETDNAVYGRTNNAYHLGRIAGGSSGGEGAIIGAGGSPLGIGADIGGSIRNPSFFNGIAGHKPSGGLLPSVGHYPPASGSRGQMCVTGPMARTVGDLIAYLEAVSPEQDPSRAPGAAPFRRLREVDPGQVTAYYYADNGLARPDAATRRNLDRVVAALAARGLRTVPWRPPHLHRSAEIWTSKVAATATATAQELLGNGTPTPLLREWLLLPTGRSRHPLAPLLMATLEPLSTASRAYTAHLRRLEWTMRTVVEARLGRHGVLICPPYPTSAPRHHAPLLTPLAFSYCGLFNALELPATAVPTGFDEDGLPLGVQVVGRRFNDPLTLWVAAQIEEAFGGWRPVDRPQAA